jgi:hypothetical protein
MSWTLSRKSLTDDLGPEDVLTSKSNFRNTDCVRGPMCGWVPIADQIIHFFVRGLNNVTCTTTIKTFFYLSHLQLVEFKLVTTTIHRGQFNYFDWCKKFWFNLIIHLGRNHYSNSCILISL